MSDGGAQRKVFGPFFDSDGDIYRGIRVKVYAVGTTNAKPYWTDEAKTSVVNTGNLDDSDSDGIVSAFFDGDYRFQVKQSDGTSDLDDAIDWDNFKVTSDTATMWEGNFGTSYPSATTANRWHQFAKVSATNEFIEMGINNGSSFVTFSQIVGKGADVVSEAALFTTAGYPRDGNNFDVTGVAGITSMLTSGKVGTIIWLRYDGVLTITQDGNNIVTPSNQNITTIAGVVIAWREYDAGKWEVIGWTNPTYIDSPTIVSPTLTGTISNPVFSGTITGTYTVSGTPTMDGSAWPSFSAYLSATQNNITGIDKILLDTEYFDTNSDYDNTVNYRFTPTVAGKYLLTAMIRWINTTASDQILIHIYKNGAGFTSSNMEDNGQESQSVTIIANANGTTDYFEVFAENVTRDTSDVLGNAVGVTTFSGSRIG